MKALYSCVFICIVCTPPAFSQQSPLLEKYRSMALEYNHDLHAADKNIASSIELVNPPALTSSPSCPVTPTSNIQEILWNLPPNCREWTPLFLLKDAT